MSHIPNADDIIRRRAGSVAPFSGSFAAILLCFVILMLNVSRPDPAKLRQFAQALAVSASGSKAADSERPGAGAPPETANSGSADMPDMSPFTVSPANENLPLDAPDGSLTAESGETAGSGPDNRNRLAADIRARLSERQAGDVAVAFEADKIKPAAGCVRMTISGDVAFDRGKASLKPEAARILEILAEELVRFPNAADAEIKVEAYAGGEAICTPQFPNNWTLSSARAVNAGLFLTEGKGIDPARVTAVGMSSRQPGAADDGQENISGSGRLEIVIR